MESTEHIYPTLGVYVSELHAPVVTGGPRERVVRCKDCKHGYELEDGTYDCTGPLVESWDYYYDKPKQNIVPPDGFRAWAEPKGGDPDAR